MPASIFQPLTHLDVDRALASAEVVIATVGKAGRGQVKLVYQPPFAGGLHDKFLVWANGQVRYVGADKQAAIQRYNVEARMLLNV